MSPRITPHGDLMGNRERSDDGRFVGKHVQLESVPRLPATLVTYALTEGREFHLVWQPIIPGGPCETAILAPEGQASAILREWCDAPIRLEVVKRPLPRRGGLAPFLQCKCSRLVRHLYGWIRVGNRRVMRAEGSWPCRVCASLTYASEGSANSWTRLFGPRNRFPWDPEVDEQESAGTRVFPPTKQNPLTQA